jgi:hypothetical protein
VKEDTHSHESGGHGDRCRRGEALLEPGSGQPTQGGADWTTGRGTAGAAGCSASGVHGTGQQGCRSAWNSRGARPPGGRSWTARQVLRLSSPVLGSASNAQGQGAVVARGEHLARRGSGRSAPGRDGRGAGRRGRAASRRSRAQAHGSGRCAAAGAARQGAQRPGLARAERRLGGAPAVRIWPGERAASALRCWTSAPGRLGAWRRPVARGGLAAGAGEPWASAPGRLRACCNRWWGRRLGTPSERRRLAGSGGWPGDRRPLEGRREEPTARDGRPTALGGSSPAAVGGREERKKIGSGTKLEWKP